MSNKELVDYIKKTKGMGFSLEEIKDKLEKAGYSKEIVDEAAATPKEDRVSNVKTFFLILLISVGIAFSLTMVYKFVNTAQKFNIENDLISAAVVTDINRCASLEDDNQRNLCFYTIAKESGDKNFCYRVEEKGLRDFCLAVLTGSEIDCSKILIEDLRKQCEDIY